jgi:hypothetical protein
LVSDSFRLESGLLKPLDLNENYLILNLQKIRVRNPTKSHPNLYATLIAVLWAVRLISKTGSQNTRPLPNHFEPVKIV